MQLLYIGITTIKSLDAFNIKHRKQNIGEGKKY